MREINNYHIQCLFQKESNVIFDKNIVEYSKKNFEQILEEENRNGNGKYI